MSLDEIMAAFVLGPVSADGIYNAATGGATSADLSDSSNLGARAKTHFVTVGALGADVWIFMSDDGSGTVSNSNGFPLASGQAISFRPGKNVHLHHIADSGTGRIAAFISSAQSAGDADRQT